MSLIGSVVESTLVQRFTEADISVALTGLETTPFVLRTKATMLYSSPKMNQKFRTEFFDEHDIFLHAKFMRIFEDQLLELVRNSNNDTLSFNNEVLCPSHDCDPIPEKLQPFFHCEKHHPFITNTKLGPCLIFKYTYSRGSETLTADLILQFPIVRMSLQDVVYSTVTDPNPTVGSLSYTKSSLGREKPLPETCYDEATTEKPTYVAIKIINYNKKESYIIRPGQNLQLHRVKGNKTMHKIYSVIKTIKKAWNLDISSFAIKKILLLRQYESQMADDGQITAENFMRILHEIMQYKELKKVFKAEKNENGIFYEMSGEQQQEELKSRRWVVRIDYDCWKDSHRKDFQEIPVCCHQITAL